MNGVLIFILLIGGYIFVRYLLAKDELRTRVKNSGGMLTKYKVLIGLIQVVYKTVLVYSDDKSIFLMKKERGFSYSFKITQSFSGKYFIDFEFELPYSKNKKSWDFEDHIDQSIVFKLVTKDIASILENNIYYQSLNNIS